MRRLSLAALTAVPILLLAAPSTVRANPTVRHAPYNGFGCGDFALGMFKKIHQHGPLFNYGPYYGYYPFTPYGPWDQYLRYDPAFYGNAGVGAGQYGRGPGPLGRYGQFGLSEWLHGHAGRFAHASWLHGGWFKGHSWLRGNSHAVSQPACSSCGGVASPAHTEHAGDPVARYSGFGSPAQSATYYKNAPTLNPVLDLVPVSGTK